MSDRARKRERHHLKRDRQRRQDRQRVAGSIRASRHNHDGADGADVTEEEGFEQFQQLSEQAGEAARKWCIKQGFKPEPMLIEAMAFSFAALMMSATDPARPPTSDEFRRARDQIVAESPVKNRDALLAACQQAEQYVMSFGSPAALLRSIA